MATEKNVKNEQIQAWNNLIVMQLITNIQKKRCRVDKLREKQQN